MKNPEQFIVNEPLEHLLYSKATRFRYALERSNKEWSPLDQCRIVTILFAVYLRKEFSEMISNVTWIDAFTDRRYKKKHGHSWLEVDGYLIDLTMDQFNHDKDNAFCKAVNANAPYQPVYACLKEESIQRKVFKSYECNEIDESFSVLDKSDVREHLYEIEQLKQYL